MQRNTLTTAVRGAMQRKEAGDRADDQLELKNVLDALSQRDEEIKAFAEKANSEIAEHGKIMADTKGALELLSKGGNDLTARLIEVEQKLARRAGADESIAEKSYGEQLTDSDDFKALTSKGRGIARMGFKAVTDITSATTGTGGVGSAATATRVPGVFHGPERPFTIRDLIMPGRTSQSSIEYLQESGFQNMAATQAEGGLKAQSDLSIEEKTTAVKTIAHWFRAAKQVLADIPLLQSYINGRAIYGLKYVEENQILAGDGTGSNLLGIIPQATAYAIGRTKTGDTSIDVISHAITQVRVAEYRATGIVMHPDDFERVYLTKDSTGNYVYLNVMDGAQPRMMRLPVIDTTAIAAGKFLVGAFDMGAQVFDREEAAVEVSTEDGDNFRTNRVTIRAEERLALAVYRPESFVYGTFPAVPAP
ncbi:MAG: phage major capsid protein [Burkholderiaceae bacterium]